MESGDNSQQFENVNKQSRRTWSKFEEDAFLNVLEDFVSKGHRCETGSFKSVTLQLMEKALNISCPGSDLKATPHLESKLKKWKKEYGIVYDMVNTSGFAWNDVKKCVEVDSNDAWETYVKHTKNAAQWRNKAFPIFERLAIIFGKDRATGKGAEVPSEMMEDQSNTEVHASDNGVDHDTSPMSFNKEGSQSISSRNKRKRGESSDEDKIVTALAKRFEESGKRMQMVTDAITKGNEDRSDIAKELKDMGLSPMDQIAALTIILDKPQTISLFKSFDDDIKRVCGKVA